MLSLILLLALQQPAPVPLDIQGCPYADGWHSDDEVACSTITLLGEVSTNSYWKSPDPIREQHDDCLEFEGASASARARLCVVDRAPDIVVSVPDCDARRCDPDYVELWTRDGRKFVFNRDTGRLRKGGK